MESFRPHSPNAEAGPPPFLGPPPRTAEFDPPRTGEFDPAYPTSAPAGYDYDDVYRRGAPAEGYYGYPGGSQAFPPTAGAHFRDPAAGGEFPPAGYGEIEGTIMSPNGGGPVVHGSADPYRNTPSPGIHALTNDRYVDHGFEQESFGDFVDDSGFRPRAAPRESYQHEDSDSYGPLKAPERPFALNGVGGALPTPMHAYGEMGPPPASLAQSSPAPPLGHEVYAPAALLRPPSADSASRVRWRDPDLHEVIDFLSNPNHVVKANAAAYLQHLCYMDDATKQKTRILGGIPPLVALLSHELPDLHRNACGALRNLSYGRQNDENKRSIKEAGGLAALVRLLRKTRDNDVKELVTGILWNLSSCEELKQSILDETLAGLVTYVIVPCSGWDGCEVERDPTNDVWWSIVFKNASGVIRNISSAGEYARTKLRERTGLVDALLCVVRRAIQGNSHDNKSVENCVCILRNLSYRCQEVEDPNYDKHNLPPQSRATATAKGDNLGCFGGSRKKDKVSGGPTKDVSSSSTGHRSGPRSGQPARGMGLLWQPDIVVQPYLSLLSDCSNPETLEAAAGALQNLAACYWQPSADVRAAVRKEKGLPILVELLRMDVDRVVCAVATALRNLAIDQRNKELIGKYAMRDLVQKLPCAGGGHEGVASDETIAAVLATLNEVIKRNAEFARSLLDAGGVDRLAYVAKQRNRYSSRVVKFASQVLFSMWAHQELREVYKKAGWKEQDFVSKSIAARNAAGGAHSPTNANNTLNRPMASQGGTRYEDRTLQRANHQPKHQQQYPRREEVPLADLGYGGDSGVVSQAREATYGPAQNASGEPVYAKVNRDKKRNRHYDGAYGGIGAPPDADWADAPPAYELLASAGNYSEPQQLISDNNANETVAGQPAGDSWV